MTDTMDECRPCWCLPCGSLDCAEFGPKYCASRPDDNDDAPDEPTLIPSLPATECGGYENA